MNRSPIKDSGKSQPKRNFLSFTKGAFGKLYAHFKFYFIYCSYTMIVAEMIHLGALVHRQIIIPGACFCSSYMWLELNSTFCYKSVTTWLYFVSGLQLRTIDFLSSCAFLLIHPWNSIQRKNKWWNYTYWKKHYFKTAEKWIKIFILGLAV